MCSFRRELGHVRLCSWSVHCRVHGPQTQPCLWPVHGRVWGRVHTRLAAMCTGRKHGRVHGRLSCSCLRPVYTAVFGLCTAVYTVRVVNTVVYTLHSLYTSCKHSRRVHGPDTAVCTGHKQGRVRSTRTAVYTAVYPARVYDLCARPARVVYGPCTRPCMGLVHGPFMT